MTLSEYITSRLAVLRIDRHDLHMRMARIVPGLHENTTRNYVSGRTRPNTDERFDALITALEITDQAEIGRIARLVVSP